MREFPLNFQELNAARVQEPRYVISIEFDTGSELGGSNLLLYSEQFDNAAWLGLAPITADDATDPEGGSTADLITDAVTGYSASIYQAVTIPDISQPITASVFIKKDAVAKTTRFPAVELLFSGSTNENYRVTFATDTGELLLTSDAGGGVTYNLEDYDSNYWRVRITCQSIDQSNTTARLLIRPAIGASADLSTSSDAAQGSVHAWGAQITHGRGFATYYETTASAQAADPFPDRIWLTSHADAQLPAGVSETNRFPGCIHKNGISGFSQRIRMDTGSHSIGSITLKALDVAGALTDEFRTRLAAGDGMRRKVVRIYKGHAALDYWNEYQLYRTHIIDTADYLDGVYTIATSDIQRSTKTDIFQPHQGVLTSSITATATTIPITIADAANKFLLVFHGAGYSANPSDSVGYIQIGDEVICHDGWNGGFTALNVIERGALGTTPQNHTVTEIEVSQRKKVTEYIYLEMAAPKLVYALLTGVLHNDAATLPAHWHLGIETDYVRLADFTGIGDDLWNVSTEAGRTMQFIGTEKTEGKKFIEKELLTWLECFMPVYNDGALGLKRYPNYLPNSAFVDYVGVSHIVKYSPLRHDMKALVNNILVRWNWIDRLDRFTQPRGFIDADSISKHGQADLLTYEFKGVFSGKQVDANIYNFFTAIRDRFSNPPIRTSVSLHPDFEPLEVGDAVRITNPHIRDFNLVDTLDRVMGIEQVKLNWSSGRVDLELFGGVEKSTELSLADANVLADSFYTATGTELSTVLTISAGAVTVNGSLTGGASLATTVFYFDGDLTINNGVTVTISRNAQLRIKGTLTVNGKIDLDGNASDGAVGSTTTGHSVLVRMRYGPQSEDENAGLVSKGAAANRAGGIYSNGVPVFNVINPDGVSLVGTPADLSGMPGSTGAIARIYGAGTALRAAFDNTAAGGAGGAGGGGLMIICRGMTMGVSSEIDCSGVAGSAGSQAQSITTFYVRGQTGAGGFPGGVLVLIDGDYTAPIFSASNVTASRGAQVVPASVDSTYPDIQINAGEEAYGQPIGTDAANYWQAVTRIQYIPAAENGYVWLPEQERVSINPDRSLFELQLSSLVLDTQQFQQPLRCAAAKPGLMLLAGDYVSSDTQLFTSPDGRVWTERSNPATTSGYDSKGASYGGGYWHVCGQASVTTGFVLYSTDAITWTLAATDPIANAPLRDIAYGGGNWVTVGDAGTSDSAIYSSDDGTSWTERTSPKNVSLAGVVYSAEIGLWCAVGNNDGADAYILTSPDGITWTERTDPAGGLLSGVAAGNGLFVAAGSDSLGTGPYIVYSSDGITWTEAVYPVTDETLSRVRFIDGLFVAVGTYDDTQYGGTMLISENGQYWGRVANPSGGGLSDIASNGSFIVVPTVLGGGVIVKSANVRTR